ncbi:MAG: signal peptidase I [Clostridia bacterium]|nr:signal peptidase I [Clostridia bacterium]
MSKEKKELTPNQIKFRNIMGWVVSALCIALIIASLVISIVTIANARNGEGGKIKGIAGNAFMPVQTDSMDPTFKAGDLIITKLYDGDGSDLQVGQVITYKKLVGAQGGLVEILVTHRISDIGYDTNGKLKCFTVVGDNTNHQDGA